MFKIPKQEYTAEFKELAVKRVQGGDGIAKAAPGTGARRAGPAQLGQGRQEGLAQYRHNYMRIRAEHISR